MKNETTTSYQERILRALAHIQGQLDAELPLEDLARVACFSPYHFHRVFRGMVGEPVGEYVRRLRLERAAHRLKRQDQPVTDLAFEAGYESHEAFTRAFRALFGAPPSEYRAAHRGAPESPSGAHYDDLSSYRPPDYGNHTPVEIRTLRPERAIFLRHTGPYEKVSGTWQRLAAWAGPRGLFGPGTRFIGLSWDDPDITAAEKLRYDAAITVNRPVQPEGDIGVTELAGGPYATIVHKGPYKTLGGAHKKTGGNLAVPAGESKQTSLLEVNLEREVNAPRERRAAQGSAEPPAGDDPAGGVGQCGNAQRQVAQHRVRAGVAGLGGVGGHAGILRAHAPAGPVVVVKRVVLWRSQVGRHPAYSDGPRNAVRNGADVHLLMI